MALPFDAYPPSRPVTSQEIRNRNIPNIVLTIFMPTRHSPVAGRSDIVVNLEYLYSKYCELCDNYKFFIYIKHLLLKLDSS